MTAWDKVNRPKGPSWGLDETFLGVKLIWTIHFDSKTGLLFPRRFVFTEIFCAQFAMSGFLTGENYPNCLAGKNCPLILICHAGSNWFWHATVQPGQPSNRISHRMESIAQVGSHLSLPFVFWLSNQNRLDAPKRHLKIRLILHRKMW